LPPKEPPHQSPRQPPRKRRTGRKWLGVIAILLFVAAAASAGTWYLTSSDQKTGASGQSGQAATGPDGKPLPSGVNAPPASPGTVDGQGKLGTPGPSAGASGSPGTGATKGPAGPPSTSGFPGSSSTGPRGVTLAAYSGPCKITKAGTVIDGKSVNCGLDIRAKNVVVKRSKVKGHVNSDDGGSVTIQDSEVDVGTGYEASVSGTNLTVQRSNIHGGEASVNCWGNCTITDSWLHGQYMPAGENWHLDAFLSNGASNVVLKHNTLACDHDGSQDGGCSANVGIFGDFAKNSRYTVDHNLFVASEGMSYCTYGGSTDSKPYPADNMVFTNNVFQRGSNGKCGQYGPVAAFDPGRPGNRWENNIWENGQPVNFE
jgi:hypothetical protein